MASSNRHWPSMYRSSLACNIQQPQPDMNNGAGGKSSLLSSSKSLSSWFTLPACYCLLLHAENR
jgi:hypothetical protein